MSLLNLQINQFREDTTPKILHQMKVGSRETLKAAVCRMQKLETELFGVGSGREAAILLATLSISIAQGRQKQHLIMATTAPNPE
jgi:hypothetical protein